MDDFDDGNQNSRIISRENAFMVFEGGFIVGNYSNGTFTGDSAITEKVMHTRQIRIGDPANNNYRRIFMSGGRMFFQQMSGTSWDANAPYIENNDAEGQIETFTGQHRNKPSSNISNYTDKKGYIVVSSGVYSNIPENRTKEEIVDFDNPKSAVVEKEGIQLGVIAQELEKVLPECVKTQSTGVKTVDSDNLTWYLINAVKELSARLDAAGL